MKKCKKNLNILIQIKFQDMSMEATKNEGLCLSTRERRGVAGIESKCHIENPCAINGKQPPKCTFFLIFNYVVRKLLKNQLMNLMEHGLNP